MLHCQISVSHGCLFGLRIIFAVDPEHLNLADFLTEIKHCANMALLRPGPAQPREEPGAEPPSASLAGPCCGGSSALGTVSPPREGRALCWHPTHRPPAPTSAPTPAPLNLLPRGKAASVGPTATPAPPAAALGSQGCPGRSRPCLGGDRGPRGSGPPFHSAARSC